MTKPTVIFLGPDGGSKNGRPPKPKIFLRSLIYSTGKRGRIIEGMYVKILRGESQQTFNIWVYGDSSLSRGSGLYVGENGIACNHHFLLPEDGAGFRFIKGDYRLNVYANLVGSEKEIYLSKIDLHISDQIEKLLEEPETGLYFDWGPDSQKYHPHVDKKREPKFPSEILDLLGMEKG